MNLTNDILADGMPWPPEGQGARLAKYKRNRERWAGNARIDARTMRQVAEFMEQSQKYTYRVVDYRILLNFYRNISLKIGDFLFQEVPTYSAGGKEGEIKERSVVINEIVDDSKLNKWGYEGAIDVSRYGDSVFVVRIKDDKAIVTISQPKYWFPISDPEDLKTIEKHVLAWTHALIKDGNKVENELKLTYQIHENGKFTKGSKRIKDGKIAGQIDEEEEVETNLPGNAVVPIQGVTTSDTVFAVDDYTDPASLINELQVRFAQVAKILDKHSEPSMIGPTSGLELDEATGEYTFKTNSYLPRDNAEQPSYEYLTWNGELESAFKEIDKLINMLAIISEMGSAIFDTDMEKRTNLSGKALRFLYVNVLSKVARYRKNFDAGFKQLIYLVSHVGYDIKFEKIDIAIRWKDGLPDDPGEKAEIGAVRLGDKPSDTLVNQIMEQDGLDFEAATEKAALIQIEDAVSIPGVSTGTSFLTEPVVPAEDEV